jgi:hypothetical protein
MQTATSQAPLRTNAQGFRTGRGLDTPDAHRDRGKTECIQSIFTRSQLAAGLKRAKGSVLLCCDVPGRKLCVRRF